MIDSVSLWTVILVLGLASFTLRFAFLGLVGDRQLPEWLLRHLRYTAVAILPALVTPLAVWPSATGGEPDPVRLTAAIVTFATGVLTKKIFLAMGAGAAVMVGLPYLLG